MKMRSGKEVFGVIWEEDSSYFFASSIGYDSYIKAHANGDLEACNNLKTPVNIDDIIIAESLTGIIPGIDMFK